MTSKLSWIFFVPFTAAAVFLMLAKTIMPDGAILGLNDMMLDYAAIGCALAVFLFALIFCLVDRKISPYYLPHRNFAAGIFGILLAVVCAADGANSVYHIFSSGAIDVLALVEAILLMLTSIVFIVLGLTHSFRNRDNKHLSIFNVFPALMFAIRLVRCFVSFTTISITTADVPRLFCYVFVTMFFFNFAVAISLTEAKHAVKSCFIYGFPAITIMAAYGVELATHGLNTTNIFANCEMLEMLLAALYIFSFLLEMTLFIKDRDHVLIGGEDELPAETSDEDAELGDDFVVTGLDVNDPDRADDSASSYLTSAETEGYLYTEQAADPDKEEEDDPSKHTDTEGYITQETDPEEDKKRDPDSPGYSERLDEIDKLILEISGDIE